MLWNSVFSSSSWKQLHTKMITIIPWMDISCSELLSEFWHVLSAVFWHLSAAVKNLTWPHCSNPWIISWYCLLFQIWSGSFMFCGLSSAAPVQVKDIKTIRNNLWFMFITKYNLELMFGNDPSPWDESWCWCHQVPRSNYSDTALLWLSDVGHSRWHWEVIIMITTLRSFVSEYQFYFTLDK